MSSDDPAKRHIDGTLQCDLGRPQKTQIPSTRLDRGFVLQEYDDEAARSKTPSPVRNIVASIPTNREQIKLLRDSSSLANNMAPPLATHDSCSILPERTTQKTKTKTEKDPSLSYGPLIQSPSLLEDGTNAYCSDSEKPSSLTSQQTPDRLVQGLIVK